jgi:polyisoprenoid-binding protein YceI
MKTKNLVLVLLLLLTGTFLQAQTKLKKAEGSKVTIYGTSTLHDWDMSSTAMRSEGEFKLNGKGLPEMLYHLSFALEVKTLSSGNSRLDNNAHTALKADQHPQLQFRSKESEVLSGNGDNHLVRVKGDLSIAGVTKPRTVEARCIKGSNGQLVCTGDLTLKMSEFDVKAPTFAFGAMKTGDEITIEYKMIYQM